MCLQSEFKIAVLIQNPAKCEVHYMTCFLHTKGESTIEMHWKCVSVDLLKTIGEAAGIGSLLTAQQLSVHY